VKIPFFITRLLVFYKIKEKISNKIKIRRVIDMWLSSEAIEQIGLFCIIFVFCTTLIFCLFFELKNNWK